jgi:hypothetical protein
VKNLQGRYLRVQHPFAAHGGDHELTQQGNPREQPRVAMVHRDHARKPDGDAESAEAKKPLTELAEALTARSLIVKPT